MLRMKNTGVAADVMFRQSMKRLRRTAERVHEDTRRDLAKALDIVHAVADIYVPVDTGALKASVVKKVYKRGENTYVGKIEYGNDRVYYAVFVHEDLTAFHAPPTQAKYLERAVHETASRVEKLLRSGPGRTFRDVNGDFT